jgi:hypothetical protein
MIITPYQVRLMTDLLEGHVISWTFAPPNIRSTLYDMIHNKHVCDIAARRVGEDERLYEFVILSKKGRNYIHEMTQETLC